MPGTNDEKPADGQTGGQPPKDGAAAGAATGGKTFTQEELDAILEARLKRAVPADYEELKKLKTDADAKANQDKTDLQKAQEAATLANANAAKAIGTANARLRRAAILEGAAAAGAVDSDIVVAMLASNEDITVAEDGDVKGVKAAIAALLKEKPFLVKAAAPAASGGEFRGSDPKNKAAKIAELESKAAKEPDAQVRRQLYAEARDLKLG